MTRYDYLIIGGGITGVTAAETIREKDPVATIAIISLEPHLLYSRVLLPSFLKNRIPREKLFLRKTEDFVERKIDFFAPETVASIRVDRKEVITVSGANIGFGKLLIACGGYPKPWHPEEEHQYRLQTLDDADRLLRDIGMIQKPLVIGGSFISLEFLEIFLAHNIKPTLIASGKHFFEKLLDDIGGEIMHNNFIRRGIEPLFDDSIATISEASPLHKVTTKGLRELHTDAFLLGIGIDRSIEFLKDSSITLGTRGIQTNEYLETNQEGIYAAGDSAEFYDVLSGKTRVLGNWTNAFLQGKRVGLNMVGEREPFRGIPTYSITNLGLHITSLGEIDATEAETVVRTNPARDQYERFFLRNGTLVGAVLINRFQDKAKISELILNQVPIAAFQHRFDDFSFDLHTISAVQ